MTPAIHRMTTIALWVVVPYILGCLISSYVLPEGTLEFYLGPIFSSSSSSGDVNNGTGRTLAVQATSTDDSSSTTTPEICQGRLLHLLGLTSTEQDPFKEISLRMHRNGEPESCGEASSEKGFFEELLQQYASMKDDGGDEPCPPTLNKYQVESLLTKTFQNMVTSCPSVEKDGKKNAGLLGFCDMGPKRTPIMLDHNDLVPVVSADGESFLPCRFHTREGLRITELSELTKLAQSPSTTPFQQAQECEVDDHTGDQTCTSAGGSVERHLYAVPAGRVFMFAPSYVGEVFHLPHVEGSDQKLIYLEVLSLSPRVFDVFNFFSRAESEDLVKSAIAETKESHMIKRSTTGASGHNLNSRRTSESGFDTHGKTAVKVKKRCFKALGFDEYLESYGDGLQILRYNVSKAYNSHLDWIEDKSGQLEHDFESGGTGGNRFATILMYMSDLGEGDGGETVFPQGWPAHLPESERVSTKDAIEALRASDHGNVLAHGSWEEDLVAKCRTRLAVTPHSSRAVLFYSQYPNGNVDPASIHGACPVLKGQKYAANLWVWNTPRQGYAGAPIKEKFRKEGATTSPSVSFKELHAVFKNSGADPSLNNAELFFEEQFWGKLGPNDPDLGINTYRGHTWNVKVDGKVVKTFTIKEEDGEEQQFII